MKTIEQVIGNDSQSNSPKKVETISELVHRHLMDEKHVTTDDEIRNATLDIYNDSEQSSVDENTEEVIKDDKLPGETDILTTPWNVLD